MKSFPDCVPVVDVENVPISALQSQATGDVEVNVIEQEGSALKETVTVTGDPSAGIFGIE